VSSGAAFSTLGLVENFGWSGFALDTTIAGTVYPIGRIAAPIAMAYGLTLLVRLPASGWKKACYGMGLLPLAMLTFYLSYAFVGSAMDYSLAGPVAATNPFIAGSILDMVNTTLVDLGVLNPLPAIEPATNGTWAAIATAELKQRLVLDRAAAIWNAPYVASCVALLVAYLWNFGLHSKSFKLFCAVCLVFSFGWANWSWHDTMIGWVLVSVYPVAILFLAAAVVRVFYRAVQDNADLPLRLKKHPRAFGEESLQFKLMTATLYWLPFLLAFVGILYLSQSVVNWGENVAYCNDPAKESCDVATVSVELVAGYEVPLGGVMRTRVGATRLPRDDLQIHVLEHIQQARDIANKAMWPASGDVKQFALNEFDKVIKPNLENYSASFRIDGRCIQISLRKIRFSLSCLVSDLKNSLLNSLYQIPRNALRNSVRKIIDETFAAAEKVQTAVDVVALKAQFVKEIDVFAYQLRRGLDIGWLSIAFLSFLQLAVMLQAVVRAFLAILARTLVPPDARPHSAHYFSMTPTSKADEPPSPLKAIPRENNRLVLKIAGKEDFYVKSALDVSNANSTFVFPIQPFRQLVGRLLHGRYFLRKLIPNNSRPLCLTDIAGKRFISLRLGDQEEVAFAWKSFVGITDNIQLGRSISLRLPMAATGHLAVPVARGPGLLVLKASGEPIVAKTGEDGDSVAPYRLIAWSTDSWFRICSSQNILSMYTEDCQIDVSKDDKAVLDIAQDGFRIWGLLRNLWAVLRP